MKIGIVGFGYIGSVIGGVLSSKGHSVIAIDSNVSAINDLKQGKCSVPEPLLKKIIKRSVDKGLLSGSSSYEAISQCDAVLVTVGTPLSQKLDADLSAIRDVFKNLARFVQKEHIIMVKSTVPPGVTRKMANDYLGDRDDIYIGFSPERLAEGNAIEEFNSLPIIVGGINDVSTSKCANFWSETMGLEVVQVSSCEAAELVKLANNQWIDLNIALSNELAMLCDSLPYKLDVLEIIKGANSLKKGQHYVNFLTPSIGVGGYCLTKDPWFVSALGDDNGINLKLPSAGRAVNDNMPRYCAEAIFDHIINNNQKLKNAKIAILGYSFKSNSGDIRFSPMITFVDEIISKGCGSVSIFDSTVPYFETNNEKVTKYPTWQECVSDADCVVFGASHDDIASIPIHELAYSMKTNGLVFDGRRYLDNNEINILTQFGVKYLGVGRSFS